MRKIKLFVITITFFVLMSLLFAEIQANQPKFEIKNRSAADGQRIDYLVDFEGPGEVKASYTAGVVNLSGKDWNLDNVLIGTTDSDRKFGERSARFRHQTALAATMTMLEDKDNGLGTLSFYYARAGFSNDTAPTAPVLVLEYSIDQGGNWSQIGGNINLEGIDQLTLYSQTVNIQGNVRVRFRTISGTEGRRFNVDDILLTDFGDPDTVAPPSFSPPGGTYYAAQMVTISTTTPEATIHYTTDNTDPNQSSPLFTEPLLVDQSMTIRARGYADDLEPSIITTAVYTINYPVMINDIATLRSSPQDGTVYTLVNEAVLSFQQSFRNQKFVQDNTAGILIDDLSGIIDTEYQTGDGISGLTGTINTYGNMVQFLPIQNPPPATSNNNPIIPVNITLEDFINNIMDYQSRLVKINNVHFTTADGVLVFNNGQTYALGDGVNTINFRTTFYDVDYIATIIPTETISLRGIPNSRAEGHFFTARNQTDFLPATGEIDLLIQPESANFGDIIVDETSAPVNFTVTNNGAENVVINDVNISGNHPDNFLLNDSHQYPVVLQPDDSIGFSVIFAPLSIGSKQAIVEIEATDDITAVSYEIPLSGIGILLLPPQNLAAEISGWHNVELIWESPVTRAKEGNRNLLGFDVYRNDILISPDTPLPPTTTSYLDLEVPAGDYDYYVAALYSAGSANSEIAEIVISGPLPLVEMVPDPGVYETVVTVTLSVPAEIVDEVIYYTLDGENPDDNSLLFTTPIVLTTTTTLKARVYKVGWETGEISTGVYTVVVSADEEVIPQFSTRLLQNQPNPFNPETMINFSLKSSERVAIEIYNIKGELVKLLIDAHLSGGEHKVWWDGRNSEGRSMPSGVYLYRMAAGDYHKIRKMVMLK